MHYSPKYSENVACHFMWSAIWWPSCCASWMPPLCTNATYWVSKEYLGGKRVCELTCCNGGVLLQCHTWIQWAFQKDLFFYKRLPARAVFSLFLVKIYYWVNQQWDGTAIKPRGMAKHVLRFQTILFWLIQAKLHPLDTEDCFCKLQDKQSSYWKQTHVSTSGRRIVLICQYEQCWTALMGSINHENRLDENIIKGNIFL